MNWFVFTLCAIVSRATYSLATRLLSKDIHVSAITQSFLVTASAGLLSLFLSPFFGGISIQNAGNNALSILLVVLSLAFGNIIYFKGQKNLDAGTTQIAFSSIVVWGVILSILFLSSHFSFTQLLGVELMLYAIVLIQYNEKRLTMNSSVLWIILSALLFSVFQVASAGVSSSVSTGTYLVLAYCGSSLITLVLYFKTVAKDIKKIIPQLRYAVMRSFFASGTSLLYFIFSFAAYRFAPDRGVVVILLTGQVVVSVIFGVIFFKEHTNLKRKLFAGVLAFLAAVLIKSF
ncbi:EamA family transporter [Candidatus Woesebacteria bacterium]|nr:EamA family transporter [Candidatus Woesebacteria bacterium]